MPTAVAVGSGGHAAKPATIKHFALMLWLGKADENPPQASEQQTLLRLALDGLMWSLWSFAEPHVEQAATR